MAHAPLSKVINVFPDSSPAKTWLWGPVNFINIFKFLLTIGPVIFHFAIFFLN